MDDSQDKISHQQTEGNNSSRTLGFLALFLILLALWKDGSSQFEPGTALNSAPLMELSSGKIVELSDLVEGEKPLAAHLFTTWCSVCMKEWSSLPELARANEKDFRTILIGVDSPEKLKALVQKRPIGIPIYVGGSEVESSLRIHSYPYTVVLTSDMRVLHDHVGVLGTRIFQKALANAETL